VGSGVNVPEDAALEQALGVLNARLEQRYRRLAGHFDQTVYGLAGYRHLLQAGHFTSLLNDTQTIRQSFIT
jgi:hypothetical protein